jgi:hypothetical protein
MKVVLASSASARELTALLRHFDESPLAAS